MTQSIPVLTQARAEYDRALEKAGPFIRWTARIGYAAKGVVYVLVGSLAALTAFGSGGSTEGSHGAMQTILQQPFGRTLLAAVALGLCCYGVWRLVQAVEDPDHRGTGPKGIFLRLGYAISGIIHFGLVVAAVDLIRGRSGGGDDSGAQHWSAWAMSFPLGLWAVGITGAIVAGVGAFQLYRAWKANLDSQLELSGVSAGTHDLLVRVSRFGIAARGITFGIIGFFLIIAAWRSDPSQAKGLGGAMRVLQAQPYGPWLLGAVALGLIAYGVYEFVRARYRRIQGQ